MTLKILHSLAKRISLWSASPRGVALLIVLVVFGATLTIRYLGWLQFLEFQLYDSFIRNAPKAATTGPIVLVEMTESDIQDPALDYPIYDVKLAELLRRLQSDQPAVIGLDIWRDMPVPKDGTGLAEFNAVLEEYPNIVAIFTLGGIAPPPVLAGDPFRIAFNDNFIVDVGVDHTIPKVRRSLLYDQAADGEIYDSFPFRLALMYLEQKGIDMGPDPQDPNGFILGKASFRPFRPNDGPYVGAIGRPSQMLFDFRCPETFTRFTVMEALTGAIPAGALRDKIVLLGINSSSVFDERVTPISRNQLGVELQAMTVNQILRQAQTGERNLQFLADWQEDTYTLLWCLIGGMIGLRIRSPWRFVLNTVACLLAIPSLGWGVFAAGWWVPIVAPAVAFAVATGLVVSFASYRERQMRGILMKLYARQVSKEIAESIWEDRDSFLDGQRPLAQKLVVTVLFTDLKGFTTISENLEVAQLFEWLDEYLGAMAKVIQDHGGVLKQFSGDGILALFGVPVPHTTHDQQAKDAVNGVNCAVEMGRRLAAMNRKWRKADLPVVSMRAGLYTGEVAAGSVGSDDRFDYSVVGDVVNTASRLESYDKTFADPDLLPNRCRILIGAPTHKLLGGALPAREIGLIEVKGKATKVAVYQVLDEVVTGDTTVSSMPKPEAVAG